MTRWQAKVAQTKHRLLLWCSKSYREHDRIISDRNHWRTECSIESNRANALKNELSMLSGVIENLQERLKLATAAHESAAQQLIAERTLRQAADERADRYHEELIESLKSSCNWSTKSLNRRSMYPEAETPDPPEPERKPMEAIRPKAFARQVARQATNSTLQEMLEQIRAQGNNQEQYGQVGPEFSSAG